MLRQKKKEESEEMVGNRATFCTPLLYSNVHAYNLVSVRTLHATEDVDMRSIRTLTPNVAWHKQFLTIFIFLKKNKIFIFQNNLILNKYHLVVTFCSKISIAVIA